MSPAPGPWAHGKAVVKGEVRYLSVSQLDRADSCMRAWWFEKVDNRKTPETKAQATGTELHASIETYLKTGAKEKLNQLAMAGFHMIPEPGPDLMIEHDLLDRLDNQGKTLATAPLRAGGIPVLGFIDLIHDRGINKGASEIEDVRDPDGTVEVLDWKTTSDFRYAKSPAALVKTIQMAGYGTWVLNQNADVRYIRLSHGYFLTKGRPQAKKHTIRVGRDEILESWEHANGVGGLIAKAAKVTTQEDVPFNLDACGNYGGCAHRSYCKAGMDVGVSVILGLTASDNLKPKNQSEGLIPVASLLSRQPKSDVDQGAVAAERARLESEERAAKLKLLVPDGFQAACDSVRSLNVGFPTLKGAAAKAYAAMGGQAVADDAEFPGTGQFGYVELAEPSQMNDLFVELKAELATNAVVNTLPPDAPISNPTLAAKTDDAPLVPKAAHANAPDPMKVETTLASGPLASVAAATEKKKREKKEKAPEPEKKAAEKVAHDTPAEGPINLFIDCRPSTEHVDLYNWVNEVADRLSKEVGNGTDVRVAPKDSALAYGAWEGALTAMVRSEEHTPLPGGNYYIDTRGSRVREIAADALKERAQLSGGFYVRSAR